MVVKHSRFLEDVHPKVAARKACKKKNSILAQCTKMPKYMFRPIEPAQLTASLPGVTSLNISTTRLAGTERVLPKRVRAIRANRSDTGLGKKKATRKKFPKSQSVNTIQSQGLTGRKLRPPEQKRGDRVTRKPPIPRRGSPQSNSTGAVNEFGDIPKLASRTKSSNSFFSTARGTNKKSKSVIKTTLIQHNVGIDPSDLEFTTNTDPYWELCQEEFFESPVDTKDEGTSCMLSGKNLATLRVQKDESDDMLSTMTVSGFGKHNQMSSRSSSRSRLSSPSESRYKLKRVPRSMIGSRRVTRCTSQRGLTLGMLKRGKCFFKCSKLCNSSQDKRAGAKRFRSFGASAQNPHKPFRKKEKSLRTKKQNRAFLIPASRKKAPVHKKCVSGKMKRVNVAVNKKPCTKHRIKETCPKKLPYQLKPILRQPNITNKKLLRERIKPFVHNFSIQNAASQPIPFSYCNISGSNHAQHLNFAQSILQGGAWAKNNQPPRACPYEGLHHSLSCSAFQPYQKPSNDPETVSPNVARHPGVKNVPAEEPLRQSPCVVTCCPSNAIHNAKKERKTLRSSVAAVARQQKDETAYLKEKTRWKGKRVNSGSNLDGAGENVVKNKIRSLSCSPNRSQKSENKRNYFTSYHADFHERKFRTSRTGLASFIRREPERSPVLCAKSALSRTSSGVQGHTKSSSGVQCLRRASSGVQGQIRASSGVQGSTRAIRWPQGHGQANRGVHGTTRANSGIPCLTRESGVVQCHTRASSGLQSDTLQSKKKLMRSASSKSYAAHRSPSPSSRAGKKSISKTNKKTGKFPTMKSPSKHNSQPFIQASTQAKSKIFPNKSIDKLKAGERAKFSICVSGLSSPLKPERACSKNRSYSNKSAFREGSDTGSKISRASSCKKTIAGAKSRFKNYASKSLTPFPIFSIMSQTSGSTLKISASSEQTFNVSSVNKSRTESDVKRAWSEMRKSCAENVQFGVKETKTNISNASSRLSRERADVSAHSSQQRVVAVGLLDEGSAASSETVAYPKATLVTTKGLHKRTYFFDEGTEEESVPSTSEHRSYQRVMNFLSNSFSSSQQNQSHVVRPCSLCRNVMSVGDTEMYRILREGASGQISPSSEKGRCELEKRPGSSHDCASSDSSTISRSTLRDFSLHCPMESDSALSGRSSSGVVNVSNLSSNSDGWFSFHSDAKCPDV